MRELSTQCTNLGRRLSRQDDVALKWKLDPGGGSRLIGETAAARGERRQVGRCERVIFTLMAPVHYSMSGYVMASGSPSRHTPRQPNLPGEPTLMRTWSRWGKVAFMAFMNELIQPSFGLLAKQAWGYIHIINQSY